MQPGRALVRTAFAGVLAVVSMAGPVQAGTAGPTITTVPVVFAGQYAPVSVSMYATCETTCTGSVFYRIAGSSNDLTGAGDPAGWNVAVMNRGATLTLGTTTVFTFTATVPGADTRGLDYVLKVADGQNTAYSPGSPAAPGLGITSGPRTGWYHVYVTNPSQIVHAPVPETGFRRAIDLSADATCASRCTATLFYRRTGLFFPSGLDFGDPPPDPASGVESQWQTVSMTLSSVTQVGGLGADRYSFTGQIPSAFVDTRGVDYAIRVTDGHTRAYAPGTSYVGYYLPEDGLRIGWYHVHVMNPVLAYHTQTTYSTPHGQALTIPVQVVCWTDSCTATMTYHSFGGPLKTVPMYKTQETFTGDARIITYAATVPAYDVVSPTLSYWFHAFDGYTNAYSPGTFYNGYYLKLDGVQVGEYTVEVG